MQNPSSLYHFETDGTGAVHQPGVLLVLLGAFIDAGNIQRTLGSHLLETGEPQIVASFDVDQLLDYRGRRPMMVSAGWRGCRAVSTSPHHSGRRARRWKT